MKFYSMYTDECLKDAKKFNVVDDLEKTIQKIENSQTANFLEKYKSPAMVKRGGRYRYIAYEKIFDEIIFIVFLKVLLKGKAEYGNFCNDSQSYSQKYLPNDQWFYGIIKEKAKAKIKEKPDLTSIEREYLFKSIPNDYEGSLMIYESQRCIQHIRKSDYKLTIGEMIISIISDKHNHDNTELRNKDYNHLIIYYKIIPSLNLLFLYQVIDTSTSEKFNEREFKKICDDANSEESILKESFRSYPDYVLYEDSIWLEIQNEAEGNLALSTEEAQIFNSIIHNGYDDPLFPLFINGRAGSGKSTLLYYTFAHILLNHIVQKKKLAKPPLFFTYSSKLLDTAKISIKKILKTNVKIRTQLKSTETQAVDDFLDSREFDNSFRTFREFQKELLNVNDKKYFIDANYYRFSNFKIDWSKYCRANPDKFIRGITAEFAWYVIRTFIKGMRNLKEEFLDIEEYVNLPRELKTVEKVTYEKIYDAVFTNWYKKHLEENKFWDDQDLTKCVLDNIENLPLDYPAVFCDEAQDFSNIELELISALSLFSKRKIDLRDVKKIPLAFAGDPLQTINPTGFKWETIKANFYEKVQNDFGKYGKVPLNFKELNNNYRSSKQIVTFNNIIQLIRAVLFDLKDTAPQKAWFTSDSIAPTLKINDLSIIEEALKEEGKTITIIIPCEEDQENDYILNRDSFLKEKAIYNDEVSQNIWGPMNVKGLEYNTVIVYNFGEYLASSLKINLTDLIASLISSDTYKIELAESKRIELEYFLNKLYVATSRAKKNLVIIDTEAGRNYLWAIFDYVKELPIKYSLIINDSVNWDENNDISEFQLSSEALDLAGDNPEDLASQYYQDGLSSSNPRKLRSAAEYYKIAHKPGDANKAFAKAYELENNYLKATEFYEKIQDGDKATQCLWKSNDQDKYTKITLIYNRLPKNPNNIFNLASKFILSPDKKNNSILFLRDYSRLVGLITDLDFYMITNKSWDVVFNELLKALVEYSKETLTLSDWDEVINILKGLNDKGIQLKTKPEYVQLLFNLKQYKDVIEELSNMNDLENDLFIKSSAFSTPYPNNLESYYKLKDFKVITELFSADGNQSDYLSTKQKEFVFNSLIEMKETQKIELFVIKYSNNLNEMINDKLLEKLFLLSYSCSYFSLGFSLIKILEIRDEKIFVDILRNNYESDDPKLITFIICLFLLHEIIFKRMYTVADLLENRRSDLKFLSPELINKPTLDKLLLYEFALMKSPLNSSLESKRRIQEYIRVILIDDKKWINLCDSKVAGAAIEKANYHVNARDFYESIFKGNFADENDKTFAKTRWLKVKMRQASDFKDENTKQAIILDTQKHYKEWEFGYEFDISEIDEYPEIDNNYVITLTEAYGAQLQPEKVKNKFDFKTSIVRDGIELFSIKSIPSKNRIKIDNIVTSETIYFDESKNNLENMEDISINKISLNENSIEFSIKTWNMILIITNQEGENSFEIFLENKSKPILKIYL